MTLRRSRSALLLLAALVITACGKKPAATEAPAPAPGPTPQQPQAKIEPRAKLIGTWERPPASDGYPVWMEFRKDGTATLKHQQPDRVQTADGTFTAPEVATGLGPYSVQVKVENGGYGLRVDFKGDELLLTRSGNEEPLTFRKAK